MKNIKMKVFFLSLLFLNYNITASKLYSMITKWQSGMDMIHSQNCFGLNFGYNGEIPFPTIDLIVSTNRDYAQYNFENHYKCFYVFVGGKYVDNMEIVMNLIKDVSNHMNGVRPIAMFLFTNYSMSEINKLSIFIKDLTVVL